MKFNLARHLQDWGKDSECHQGSKCLCKRFADGEEMFDPSKLPAKRGPQKLFPPPIPRDPSQSEQPMHTEQHERAMEHLLEQ